MIVYLDPDDYKEETRKKQEIRQVPMPVPRPGSNQQRNMRRKNRTNGMKTAVGFFPQEKSLDSIDEGI